MPGILAFGKPMWEDCLKLTAAWHSEFWASMRYNETLPLPKKKKKEEKKRGIEVAQPLKVFVPKLDIHGAGAEPISQNCSLTLAHI